MQSMTYGSSSAPSHLLARWRPGTATLAVVALAACVLVEAKRCEGSPTPKRVPNIVLILADDLGYSDLGCYGSRFYQTQNLDRLASQGMRFTAAYTNGPNCAPTRACLMSGQYGPRHGVFTVGDPVRAPQRVRRLVPPKNKTELAAESVTLAESLKRAGYATAAFGKWHLGGGECAPTKQGFDRYVGKPPAGSPPWGYFLPKDIDWLNAKPGDYLTDCLTDCALQFIDAVGDEPFFLYQAFHSVHTPIQGKPELIQRYRGRPAPPGRPYHHRPDYAAMVHSLDENVGRILDKLAERGLARCTLVIFLSDNGGVGGYRAAGVPAGDITDNHPLRGGKGMLYEGGIRVPMIVRWPGRVEAGSTCDEPVITTDLYPTLLSVADTEAEAGQVLDGESLLPLFVSDGPLEREAIFWHFPAYLQAQRYKPGRRPTCRTRPAAAVRSGRYKLIEFFEDKRLELYDLEADLGEQHDLSDELPEVARRLHRLLIEWRETTDAPMPRPNPDYSME